MRPSLSTKNMVIGEDLDRSERLTLVVNSTSQGNAAPLSAAQLSALAATAPPPDAFGPQSAQSLLAIDLDGADRALGGWLGALPCPVIGVGEGELASACDAVIENPTELAAIAKNVAAAPFAAMVLVQHLRASRNLSIDDGLTAESFAYGTVQRGPEFLSWRRANCQAPPRGGDAERPLAIDRDGGCLRLTLNRPETRNEIDTEMRDALCEAFDNALLDPSITHIHLTGAGAAFSIGGAVSEFGSSCDPTTAHWVRSLRLPARNMARLADRLHIHVNGAAIGAGAELAAFGGRVTAGPNAWFQLPELKYGLIPGAGGTVSLPRRIGRQRTAYLALSMRRLRAYEALSWGLIDAIEE